MRITELYIKKDNWYSEQEQQKQLNFANNVEAGLSAIRESIKNKIGRNIDNDLEMFSSFIYPNTVSLIANEDIKRLYLKQCSEELELFLKITNIKIGGLKLI